MRFVDDRAHPSTGVERVARSKRSGSADEIGDELLGNRTLNEQTGIGGAHGALVVERPEDRHLRGLFEVGVGEDQIRALAAAFQPHLLQIGVGCVVQEPFAGRGRAGEGQHVDVRVKAERGARSGAEPRDHVQDARRKSRFDGQFGQTQGRQRRLFGGFEHDAVTDRKRRRDLPDGEVEWKVPRRHRPDDTKGLPGDQRQVSRFGRRDLTVDLVERLAVEGEEVCSRGYVDVVRLGHQLAHVHGVEQGKFSSVFDHQLGQPDQNPFAMSG